MGRRQYLTSLGALGASASPFIGSATADDSVSAAEAGIHDRVADLLLEERVQEAQELLEKHNVRYGFQQERIPGASQRDLTANTGISTLGHYDDSDSELVTSVVESYNDRWIVTATMSLRDRKLSARDASIVDDGFGIVYDSSEWSAPEPTESGVKTHSRTAADGSVSLEYQDFAPEKGLAYDVDLPYLLDGETSVTLQTDLKKVDSGNDGIPVKAEYKHTWAAVDLPWPFKAEATAGIGPIGITMNLDSCTVLWEDEVAVEPGEIDQTT